MFRVSVKKTAALVLGISALAGMPAAQATLSVSIANKGGAGTDGTFYYGAAYGSTSAFIFDTNPSGYQFGGADVTRSAALEAGSLVNALSFLVSSDKVVAGNLVLMVSTTSSLGTGGVYKAVPIAGTGVPGGSDYGCGAAGSTCTNGTAGQIFAGSSDPSGGQYYFASTYAQQQQLRLDLYPRDICTSYTLQPSGGTAAGCVVQPGDPTHQTAAIGPAASNVQFTFQLVLLDAGGNYTSPPAAGAVQDSAVVNLHFEDNARTATCPSVINYFPGDSQIFADTSGFLPGIASGYAQLTSAIVALKKNNGTPNVTTNFLATGANDVVTRTGLGVNAQVGGFTNVTSLNDSVNTYGIGFMLRDAAGVVTVPSGTGCILNGVQTSNIQGFLSKSKCFIATAAFRSVDSSPVEMLRAFRDQVLFKSELGTEFVHWYYRWSPPAAEWLMKNPEFRYPVLQALIPVELTAWFMLHPVHLTMLLIFAASSLVLGIGFAILMRLNRRNTQ